MLLIWLFSTLDNILLGLHPEALIHSIIEYNDYTSRLNYFYNDMLIPIINFYNSFAKIVFPQKNLYSFKKKISLDFHEVDNNKFRIYKIFRQLDSNNPQDYIKFNLSNQYAVELFINNKIRYLDIIKIIEKSLSFDFNASINSIGSIIKYEKEFNLKLQKENEIL